MNIRSSSALVLSALLAPLPMLSLTALLAAGATLPAAAEPVTYVLDAERSSVHFELLHFSTSTIRGHFGPVQGTVTLDRQAGSGNVGVRVATAAVSTGIPVFDARIRQTDLLNSASYPEAFFVATRLRFDGDRLAELRGEFTLRGVSQPLTLRALRFACRQDAPGEVCGGDFEGAFKRSEFGAGFGLPFVADTVRLLVLVQGRRAVPPAPASTAPSPENPMPQAHANGDFDVKLLPQPLADSAADATLSRMALDKAFHGDLQATSKGEMLAAGTAVKGSAGYVAIERVTGTLHGRSGSFVLQHTGTMDRGVPQLSVTVVPDSGTGQLQGLAGRMQIIIAAGKHSYTFDYTLPAVAPAP